MRKLIALFAFMVIALTSYAQNGSKHYSFKGIPIEGSWSEFCKKLKAKEFKSLNIENNLALFTGNFTGRSATIGITATEDEKSVPTSYTQSCSEHLSFKGIPIDGSIIDFCEKLKAKGFTPIEIENDIALFTGDFTGRSATIGVTATDYGKSVFAVSVLFDPSDEWNTLANIYDYCKDLYLKKYGRPVNSEENNPATSYSNTDLMKEVQQGTVVWFSRWRVRGGEIMLSIENFSEACLGMVIIRYRDAQNVEIKTQNDLEDI